MTKEKEKIYRFIIGFCILSFILVFYLLFFRSPSEGFTQLYFEDYEKLPYEIPAGGEYNIKFTVVSFENEKTEYNYTTSPLNKKGSFSLMPGEKKTIEHKFKGLHLSGKGTYEVKLLNKNESQTIYFLFERK